MSLRRLVRLQRVAWSELVLDAIEHDGRGLRAWSFGTLTFPPAFFDDRLGRRLSVYGMRARADAAWSQFVAYIEGRERGHVEWVRAEEPHASGLLHYHALMARHFPDHEVAPEWIRARVGVIEGDWCAVSQGGISRWRPVNERRVWYLTKYVVKGGAIEWSDSFANRVTYTRAVIHGES